MIFWDLIDVLDSCGEYFLTIIVKQSVECLARVDREGPLGELIKKLT